MRGGVRDEPAASHLRLDDDGALPLGAELLEGVLDVRRPAALDGQEVDVGEQRAAGVEVRREPAERARAGAEAVVAELEAEDPGSLRRALQDAREAADEHRRLRHLRAAVAEAQVREAGVERVAQRAGVLERDGGRTVVREQRRVRELVELLADRLLHLLGAVAEAEVPAGRAGVEEPAAAGVAHADAVARDEEAVVPELPGDERLHRDRPVPDGIVGRWVHVSLLIRRLRELNTARKL